MRVIFLCGLLSTSAFASFVWDLDPFRKPDCFPEDHSNPGFALRGSRPAGTEFCAREGLRAGGFVYDRSIEGRAGCFLEDRYRPGRARPNSQSVDAYYCRNFPGRGW